MVKKTVAKRVRARNEDGTLKGDDPTTPDVNEAWVDADEVVAEEKVVAKKAPNAKRVATEAKAKKDTTPGFVYYVSADKENAPFDLKIDDKKYRGTWDVARQFVTWRIPADIADLADKHHHIWSGRILRCKD